MVVFDISFIRKQIKEHWDIRSDGAAHLKGEGFGPDRDMRVALIIIRRSRMLLDEAYW